VAGCLDGKFHLPCVSTRARLKLLVGGIWLGFRGFQFFEECSKVPQMSHVTRILDRAWRGDARAAEELLPLVYEELRGIAAEKMAQQPPGQTLQATALVHEAWLKLTGNENSTWHDRQHFFRAAAQLITSSASSVRTV